MHIRRGRTHPDPKLPAQDFYFPEVGTGAAYLPTCLPLSLPALELLFALSLTHVRSLVLVVVMLSKEFKTSRCVLMLMFRFSLCLPLSLCLSACLILFCLPLPLSLCLSLCLSTSISLCASVPLSFCASLPLTRISAALALSKLRSTHLLVTELAEVSKFGTCAARLAQAFQLPRHWSAFVASDTDRMVQFVSQQLGPRAKSLNKVAG
jgi:hypothetical protein